jgi:hypothetical protein
MHHLRLRHVEDRQFFRPWEVENEVTAGAPGADLGERLGAGAPGADLGERLLIVALFGGLTFSSYVEKRSQQLEEEKSAAQAKERPARDLVSQLNNLAPGNIDEFNATGQRRQEFVHANPSFRDQLDSAEDKWMKRTLDAFEGQVAADPATAITRLRELQSGCQKGSGQRLLPQVQQALEHAAGSAAEQSADLLERDNVQALDFARRCLAPFDRAKEGPPKTLTETRQRALDHCVKDLSGQLKKIPVDDGIAMAGWLERRQAVENAAGATVAELRQAEGCWLAETVAAVLKAVEPQAAQQPEKAFARLEQTRTTYANLFADHPDAAKALTAGEERCLAAVVILATAEARKQTDLAAASKRLQKTATVCAGLLERYKWPAKALQAARREVVHKALKKASAAAYNLIQGDRFQGAAHLAEQLSKDFGAEAEAVGLAAMLVQFRDECGYYADLARQAGRTDPR